MKAKTYYIHPEALKSPERLTALEHEEGRALGDIKIKLIKQSDVEKMVEQAALAMVNSDREEMGFKPTKRLSLVDDKATYLRLARAQFKSIGLLP